MEHVKGRRDNKKFNFICVGFDFNLGHPGNMGLELSINVGTEITDLEASTETGSEIMCTVRNKPR